MNNRTIEIGSELESLLRPTFSNMLVNPGPWLIIVGALLGLVFLVVCVVIYLQRPTEEDKEDRPTLTIKVRGPASNLVRPRRPGNHFSLPPPAAVPSRARWEAMDEPLAPVEGEPILEAETAEVVGVAEEEPLFSPDPPFAEPPPRSTAIEPVIPRQPLIPTAPPVYTAAFPSFLFENVQSTTTPRSVAFGLQATTLRPPRSARTMAAPHVISHAPEAVPEPMEASSPVPHFLLPPGEIALPDEREPVPSTDRSADAQPMLEPIRLLPPVVEVRTEALPPPRPPIPEIRTEPLPPAPGEIVEDEPFLEETPAEDAHIGAERTLQPSSSGAIPLRPSPSITVGQDPSARLTPFQRMKRRRAIPTLDKNGRAIYITYTFDPDAEPGSDEKPGA